MVHVADVTLRWSLCGLLDFKQCTIVSADCAALENKITPLSSEKEHSHLSEGHVFCFELRCVSDG